MSLKEIMNYRKTTTFSQNAKFTKPPKKIKLGAFKNPRNFFKNSKKLKISSWKTPTPVFIVSDVALPWLSLGPEIPAPTTPGYRTSTTRSGEPRI